MSSELQRRVILCVPCYRESLRLPVFLQQMKDCDQKLSFQLTVLFLDDGSGPQEQQQSLKLIESAKFINFATSAQAFPENRGKGAVLRDGFKKGLSEGFDYIGFLDSDGATPFYEGLALITEALANPQLDGILGSRLKCLGKKVERSFKRHLSGRIFATILSNLFEIPVYDSQCGAKIFKASALTPELLDQCYDQRWLFDTQLLILLYQKGFQLREKSVDWTDIPGSKVHLLRDSWRMFMGLLKFKHRA